jgi:hypothetical protein
MGLDGYKLTIPRRMTGQTIETAHLFNATSVIQRMVDAENVDAKHKLIWDATGMGDAQVRSDTMDPDNWAEFSSEGAGDVVGIESTYRWTGGDVDGTTSEAIKMTKAAATGAVRASHYVGSGQLITLPNWNKMIHIRFRNNASLSGATAVIIDLEVAITNGAIPLTNDKMRFRWTLSNTHFADVGRYVLSANLYLDSESFGSNLNLDDDTDIALGVIAVKIEDADTNDPNVFDFSIDEIWFTDVMTLGPNNGVICMWIDDTIQDATLRLARVAEHYGIRLTLAPEVLNISGTTATGGTSCTWEELAKLSEAGHGIVLHDGTDISGYSESRLRGHLERLLQHWYDNAPKYGIVNWEAAARFYLARDHNQTAAFKTVGPDYFVQSFATHSGGTNNVHRYNTYPRGWGCEYRNGVTTTAADFTTNGKIRTWCHHAHTNGGVLHLLTHTCNMASGASPDTADFINLFDYLSDNNYRVVTPIELYGRILPNELRWEL